LLRNEGMGGIRLSKSSVQMLDIVALLLRMRRVNSALTLIFRKKSNLINGKSSLGDGWSNVPSPGSTIPDVSAKIMRFPSLLLRLWLKSPISIPYSSAYEYSFLDRFFVSPPLVSNGKVLNRTDFIPSLMYTVYEMSAIMADTSALVFMTEANQNFLKVIRLVDEAGLAVILKNNKLRYIVVDFEEYGEI